MPKCQHEEHEADPVAEEAGDSSNGDDAESGQRRPDRKAEGKVDRSCHQPLQHGNQDRVCQRHLPREVVVDPPCHTRPGDRERAKQVVNDHTALEGEHDRASENRRHANGHARVHRLAKEEPCDERGRDAFQSQQQRSGRTCGRRKAEHQKHRRDEAARADCPSKPREVRAGKPSLTPPAGANGPKDCESNARAEVEEPGRDPWIDAVQHQFGDGR